MGIRSVDKIVICTFVSANSFLVSNSASRVCVCGKCHFICFNIPCFISLCARSLTKSHTDSGMNGTLNGIHSDLEGCFFHCLHTLDCQLLGFGSKQHYNSIPMSKSPLDLTLDSFSMWVPPTSSCTHMHSNSPESTSSHVLQLSWVNVSSSYTNPQKDVPLQNSLIAGWITYPDS